MPGEQMAKTFKGSELRGLDAMSLSSMDPSLARSVVLKRCYELATPLMQRPSSTYLGAATPRLRARGLAHACFRCSHWAAASVPVIACAAV